MAPDIENSRVAWIKSIISSSVPSPRIALRARQTKRQLSGVYPAFASFLSMVGDRMHCPPTPENISTPDISHLPVHRAFAQSAVNENSIPVALHRFFAVCSILFHGRARWYALVYSRILSLFARRLAKSYAYFLSRFFLYHSALYARRCSVVLMRCSRFLVSILSLFRSAYSRCRIAIRSLFLSLYAANKSLFCSLHFLWYSASCSFVRTICATFNSREVPILLGFSQLSSKGEK